ncbi:MAG: adenylate/guanylate cyclase domain-containing protein [Treponema sp.]|nr:adenylate/guanylate cyclase domain-containing protein [Treponema sp.]
MDVDLFNRIGHRFKNSYHMPDECWRISTRKNITRIIKIFPITFFFGAVMTVLSFILPVYNDSPEHRNIAVIYYGCFALFSTILMVWCLSVRNRPYGKTGAWQRLPVYISFILFHALSLYNILASKIRVANISIAANPQLYDIFSREIIVAGYLVWVIIILVILAFFEVHPFFFFWCETAQLLILFTCRKEAVNRDLLNLIVLIIIAEILSFMHWKLIIQNFKSTEALKAANKKSDELLLNILPPKVVHDLRERGKSEPELFRSVSVLFTDIVGFTSIAKTLPPETLINELDDMFTNFDIIIEKYNCMRIKTMGDAYMAVCGLPEQDPDHARKIVNAGIECLDYLNKRNNFSKIKWKMRVGISSGDVVAGIIGIRKYIYDVLGDTVNTAFRMQTMSDEMQLNVSESTYNCTKKYFIYEKREPVEVKGKGTMTMYFVRGKSN